MDLNCPECSNDPGAVDVLTPRSCFGLGIEGQLGGVVRNKNKLNTSQVSYLIAPNRFFAIPAPMTAFEGVEGKILDGVDGVGWKLLASNFASPRSVAGSACRARCSRLSELCKIGV